MPVSSLTAEEQLGFKRGEDFVNKGSGYSLEHATRPATIGLILGSNPIALLAWIGEKFLAWPDEDPELEKILESVTLYWLTETFPTSIYPYRAVCEPLSCYSFSCICHSDGLYA
jgi:microsomal epoxide hydrolase